MGWCAACSASAGALLVWLAWPVTKSAWQAQQADAATTALRLNYKITLDALLNAIDALDRAVDSDPTASRHFQRSELLVGAALSPNFAPTASGARVAEARAGRSRYRAR